MAKKKKSGTGLKKKSWECDKCVDWKKNPHVCKHLEALINSKGKSVPIIPVRNIEDISGPVEDLYTVVIPYELSSGLTERRFKKKLRSLGLDDMRVEVLAHKFIYDMSLAEISQELSIPNRQTVHYLLKTGVAYIKNKLKGRPRRGQGI